MVHAFLHDAEDLAHEFLTEQLDGDCDTKEQVEAVVELFPGVLSEVYPYPIHAACGMYDEKLFGECDVNTSADSIKTMPFAPLLAELGVKHNRFDDSTRGGLLLKDVDVTVDGYECNPLQFLACSTILDTSHLERQKILNGKSLDVMKELRRRNLVRKEDISKYKLLEFALVQGPIWNDPNNMFRYLCDWNPQAAHNIVRASTEYGIGQFELALDVAMTHFPTELGFLYHKNSNGENHDTPFQLACKKYGRNETINIVECQPCVQLMYGTYMAHVAFRSTISSAIPVTSNIGQKLFLTKNMFLVLGH